MEVHFVSFTHLPLSLIPAYQQFLSCAQLFDEADTDYTILALDEMDEILGCASLRGNVLKQIAVSSEESGTGLCAQLVTMLIEHAVVLGHSHLFVYTKPTHRSIFSSLGFYPIVETSEILMMENRRNGLSSFLSALPKFNGLVGTIVCNCNPFTRGHRQLIECASSQCDHLLVFVLSEDLSLFPSEIRYRLVQEGTSDLPNVHVFRSKDYLISRATFPAYFLKESIDVASAQCDLDLQLFVSVIAPTLNIRRRYVGEEPFDRISMQYNNRMKKLLPAHGIEVVELPRYQNISASHVRQLLKEGRIQDVEPLLPPCTYEYCRSHFRGGTLCP